MSIDFPQLNFAALLPLTIVVITGLVVLMLDLAIQDKRTVGWLSLVGVGLAGVVGYMQQANPGFDPTFQRLYTVDGYSHFFNLLFLVTAGLSILVAMGYLGRMDLQRGEYFTLLLFATSGMMVMAGATDLMIVFLGLEIMSIALYVMSAINRRTRASGEAGLKYFMLGAYASAFFLYGVALIYGATGSTNFNDIAAGLTAGDPLALLGLGLMLIGFAFKVAAVPFHWWTPDVYVGAPTAVTTFMSVGAKAAGFAALVRVLMVSFSPTFTLDWQIAIAVLAVLTMTLGNLAALAQKDVKRMLAYSSIAHAGYIFVGVAAGTAQGVSSALFYLMVYAFMNIGAFAIIGLLDRRDEVGADINDYAGLSARNPWLAAAMAIFMLSLTGFPPLAGFWGKLYLFSAAVDAGLTWLAVIGMINSGVAAFYYLGVIVQMYFHRSSEEAPALTASTPTRIALILSAVATVAIGLFPAVLVNMTIIDFLG